MMNIIQKRIKINPAYFSIVFLVICFLYYNAFVNHIVWNASYIFVSIISLIYLLLKKNKDYVKLILFCMLTLFCGIASGIHSGNFNLSLLFKSLCYIIIAYFLVNNNISIKFIKIWFYASFFILMFALFNKSIDINHYFTSLSRNYFSVLMLPPLIIYYNHFSAVNSNKISIVPSLCYLIVSLLAIGRGGIVTALILFILTLLFILQNFEFNKKILLVVILVTAITIIKLNLNMIQPYISRFVIMGFRSEGRAGIWIEYLRWCTVSFDNFLFGVSNMQNVPIFNSHAFNLHNSFFQMHSQYGFIFVLVYMLCLFKSIIKCLKKKQFFIIIIAVAFFCRAFVDQLGYAFYTEVFFYFFMLYGEKEIQNNSSIDIQSDKFIFKRKDSTNA